MRQASDIHEASRALQKLLLEDNDTTFATRIVLITWENLFRAVVIFHLLLLLFFFSFSLPHLGWGFCIFDLMRAESCSPTSPYPPGGFVSFPLLLSIFSNLFTIDDTSTVNIVACIGGGVLLKTRYEGE